MQSTLLKPLLLGVACSALLATSAQARNATVENALKSRPDLSDFYNGLVSTGVIDELKPDQPYTVFAPTNAAFDKISASSYPCFYSPQCKADVAQVLRGHIVPGEKHLSDIGTDKGGILSLYSIDHQHITASEISPGTYTVEGCNVLSENQLLGGVLYKVNGVIADDKEMAKFEAPSSVTVISPPPTNMSALPPRTPAGDIVSITRTGDGAPVVTTQKVVGGQ